MATTDPYASPMGGRTRVESRDRATVHVEVAHPHLSVVVERGGTESARVDLPYPRAGYGGHELLLSPDERYLVLWLYSGQSEVGYELFRFGPALQHVSRFAYVFGHGVGPVFSADESQLALAWTTNSGLLVEEAELDVQGCTLDEHLVEWATVRLEELPTGPVQTCRILAQIPAGFPFEGDDSWVPSALEIVPGRELRLATEWGARVRVPLPLPEFVTVPGPASRAV